MASNINRTSGGVCIPQVTVINWLETVSGMFWELMFEECSSKVLGEVVQVCDNKDFFFWPISLCFFVFLALHGS